MKEDVHSVWLLACHPLPDGGVLELRTWSPWLPEEEQAPLEAHSKHLN